MTFPSASAAIFGAKYQMLAKTLNLDGLAVATYSLTEALETLSHVTL